MTKNIDEAKKTLGDAISNVILPQKFRGFIQGIIDVGKNQPTENLLKAVLFPSHRLVKAFEEFLKPDDDHVIAEGGLICEATFKPLYFMIFGRGVPKSKPIYEIANEFKSQTKVKDERLQILLPSIWQCVYNIRSKKTGAHLSEETLRADAIFVLTNSLYLVLVYYDLLFEIVCPDKKSLDKLHSINAPSMLFESIKEVLITPTLSTTIPEIELSTPFPQAIIKLLQSSYAINRGGLKRNEIISAFQYRKYPFSSIELNRTLYNLYTRGKIRRKDNGERMYFIR